MDFNLEDMFGSSPKTILEDQTIVRNYSQVCGLRQQLISNVS